MTEILFVKLFRYNQLCIRKIHSASRPPPSSSRNRNRERACGGVRRAMCHDIVMPESSVHKKTQLVPLVVFVSYTVRFIQFVQVGWVLLVQY